MQSTDEVDVVVFSAPQLSLYELRALAELCDGRRFMRPLLAMTSPQVKPDADRMGYTARIEAAGGTVLAGMCFYQSYAREMAEANGWKRLATNSAKLVNILGGYGYVPMLASMERCVEAAETGRLRMSARSAPRRPASSRRATRSARRCAATALVANDGFSARYDLDRIAGVFSRPGAQARGPVVRRPHPGARHRQGRRRQRLDAARDGVARRSCRWRSSSTR